MAQKTNPIIFQLKKTSAWKSKYIEKKASEFLVYSKQNLEIKNFIVTFFEKYGIIINNCKFYYLNHLIHISISYQQNLNILKKSFKSWKKKLFLSLIHFKYKKYKLLVVLEQLNINVKQIVINKKNNKLCKKNLINLRKYNLSSNLLKKQNNFFKLGISIVFNCIANKKCAKLLGHFIITQLKILDKFKRHNFFLNFIKNTLKLFKNNNYSKFKGIKIKIKGRLNGRPRSNSKTIIIANNVSLITINSIIDYSSQTAFTSNGTLGVKTWVHEV